MKQLFKELFMLLLIMPICVGILFFVMQKIEQSRQIVILNGSVENKELNISSPVFGSIEEFPVEEGTIVKKNQPLAVIAVIDKKNISSFSAQVYQYQEETNEVIVKSPVDAVVSVKELAEKSTVKPEANIVTLHPLTNTVIKIQVNSEKDLKNFESLIVTDKSESFSYDIALSDRLPVSDKAGNTFYYAKLKDPSAANDLYNNQKVVVKVRRTAKALTGRFEAMFADVSQQIATLIGTVL